MTGNEQSRKTKKEIGTLEWDLPNITDMDLKLSKEKRLKELKDMLNINY